MADTSRLGSTDPAEQTLPEVILSRAEQTPHSVAVRQWSTVLTYQELVACASALAEELHVLGAGPETRVGLCAGREPSTIAALLGVWFAGAAYVPVDLANPGPRGRSILSDAGADLVVADAAGRKRLGANGLRYLDPPSSAAPAVDPKAIRSRLAQPQNLAYVMYTSGSSGPPKGVLATHRNLAQWVAGCATWIEGVGPQMCSLALHSFAFDASCYDLFVPLAHGGSVRLVDEDDRADPARLERFMAEHEVTWAAMPPGVAALLDPCALSDLRALIVGGEVVPAQLVSKWTVGTECRFYHAYGPTEATVVQVATELRGHWQNPLPLGKALPGQRLHVLDTSLEPVPPGKEGELCIAGTGVARGYSGRPGLTAELFVPEPDPPVPGTRMYRTGDIVRRLPGGGLVFVGRRDGQVQVRGQRVEMGDVEAAIREHPQVRDVAVVATVLRQNTELVGFVVPALNTARRLEANRLREFVAERLPPAMVPRQLEWLERLPLTVSGKIDRKRLAERASLSLGGEVPEAGNAMSRLDDVPSAVAHLWQRVLGGAEPTADADFYEVGGSSLDAMRLAAAIRTELGRGIEVADILAARTLGELTRRARDAAESNGTGMQTGNPPRLSAAQRRLWFLDKLIPGFAVYNLVFAERLSGDLNPGALRTALEAVAERQTVLRWRIPDVGGSPRAVCDPTVSVSMPEVEIEEAELGTVLKRAARHPFELSRGPLWSAVLYRLVDSGDHVLVIAFDHTIMDGWSQGILYTDLSRAYERASTGRSGRLPALAFEYADYVAWRAERDRTRSAADLRWWSEHLQGVPGNLSLPRDRPAGPVPSWEGSAIGIDLGESTDRSVRRLAATLGVTSSIVILAALAEALHRLVDSTDLLVGAVLADRNLAATHDIVGFFVDIVPLRLRTAGEDNFTTAVRSVGEELRAASARTGATLEQIVDAIGATGRPGRSPLIQVVFNAFDFTPPRLDLPGTESSPVTTPISGAPVELTVYVVERGGRLALDLRYDTDLFDRDRIQRFGDDLVDLLSHLVTSPERPVAAAPTGFRIQCRERESARLPRPIGMKPMGGIPPFPDGQPTRMELLVAEVWSSVLDVPEVRSTDNFFEIGGNSLALAQVQAHLGEATGRTIPLIDLFQFPSVYSLARHLEGAAADCELIESARLVAARRARNQRRRNHA